MTDEMKIEGKEAVTTFSIFNSKANKQIHNKFIAEQERYRRHIENLERILRDNDLEVPEFEKDPAIGSATRDRSLSCLMEDGSLPALSKSVERTAVHDHCFEIHVQYRNLTFWNMVPKNTIPTVGTALRSMIMGSGKKHRVNILNDLTGRILPKRMTLVMGPPGCGK